MEHIVFREMKSGEAKQLFKLILERMKWMDESGIEHWNTFRYDEVFPLSYYEEKCREGKVFVLADQSTGELLSGAVLLDADDEWKDDEPACYIHNFVSKTGGGRFGGIFLDEVEQKAKADGRRYVRLDVLASSEALARYYEARGYEIRGTCQEGDYVGVLREKKIS